MGSSAQENIPTLGRSMGSSSTVTGRKTEYLSASAQKWVEEKVRICEHRLLMTSLC